MHEASGFEPEGLCAQPKLSRLFGALASEADRAGLARVLLETTRRRMELSPAKRLPETTVDLDSMPLEVFGHQPGSGWNGHYRRRYNHPLVARAEWGDTQARRSARAAYTRRMADAPSSCRSCAGWPGTWSGCSCGSTPGVRKPSSSGRWKRRGSGTWHG